jgi:hypothetical protein
MHSHKTNNSNLNSSKDKDSSKMANILAAEPNAETGDVAEETGIKRVQPTHESMTFVPCMRKR